MNLDGRLDINDLTIVLSNFGQTGMTWSQGDFNDDGTVDINDLTIVLTNFGQIASTGIQAVPEPSCPALPGIGGASLLAFADQIPGPGCIMVSGQFLPIGNRPSGRQPHTLTPKLARNVTQNGRIFSAVASSARRHDSRCDRILLY